MTAPIRPSSGAAHTRMLGIGAYRPSRVVTNEEICRHLDSDEEWILTRSGIRTRHWAGPGESLLEMSTIAAGKALAQSGVMPSQVGCVLVATSTHTEHTPPLAPRVADRLGCTGVAFDLSAGCAGFCLGLALASDSIRSGSAEYSLVIGAERLSFTTDPTDRSSAFLFGDGAGAAVVGPSEFPGIGPVAWGSDGSRWKVIRQTYAWERLYPDPIERLAADHVASPLCPGAEQPLPLLRIEGQEVFRWACYQMAPLARQALEKAGVSVADLDAFIPHQANLRITEMLSRALHLPSHIPVARDIVESGNTSAASIPLAIERMLASGEAPSGGTALLIGFGAGLIYAAQVVALPSVSASPDPSRSHQAHARPGLADADTDTDADAPERSPASSSPSSVRGVSRHARELTSNQGR